MTKIYEVRSIDRDGAKQHAWGARHSHKEAEVLLLELTTGTKKEWADRYHERWWVEEIDTTGMFEVPPAPPPREVFRTKVTEIPTGEGTWDTLHVEVLDASGRTVASYDRNYPSLYRTFEPFRQRGRTLALFSSDYTATSVMDLSTGQVIAAEEPHAMGFCPTGFYVPDWWDVNDGSTLPGSSYWSVDDELPRGDFGFVWGCVWGDDSSWKVQYLDLSRVQEGVLHRDDRFGYIELATHEDLHPKSFIACSFEGGKCRVTFSVLSSFDLDTGKKVVL